MTIDILQLQLKQLQSTAQNSDPQQPQQLLLEMSAAALTADGLWHCLCPSFGRFSLKPTSVVNNSQKSKFLRPRITASPAFPSRCRLYSEQRGRFDIRRHGRNTGENQLNQATTSSLHTSQLMAQGPASAPPKRFSPGGKKKREPKNELPSDLVKRSTSNLENILQDHVENSPTVEGCARILQILIRDRQVRPQVRHYRALILANTDAKRGSPVQVRKLLQEMEHNGVPADSGTLHAALKVKSLANIIIRTPITNNTIIFVWI